MAAGTWNGAGQLTAYSNAAANMSAAAYDGSGLRVSSATTPTGGSTATQQYVWNTVAQVPQLIMDSSNAYIYGDGGTPDEQVNLSTGAITYLVADALGSVRGVVGSSGSLTGTTSYDAWGNATSSGGLTGSTPFGFAGGYTDPTGLIYLLNRYYDPSTGQFISVDPQLDQTQAPYSYANDDPVKESDPTGQSADLFANFGGTVVSGGGSAGGGSVSFSVPFGVFYTEIVGRGGYVKGVSSYFHLVLPGSHVWYPRFTWIFQTPSGRFYRYESIVYKGRHWSLGDWRLWFNWPFAIPETSADGPWWRVRRTFPVGSGASTIMHSELVVEDPKNATRRAIAAEIYHPLG
jgi:RHS repeat-associated protein